MQLRGEFAGFVDEFDGDLIDEDALQGGEAEFERLLVEPFDDAFHALAVVEHDDHGRLRLDLLLEVEDFGVAGFGLGCAFMEVGGCFADDLARGVAVGSRGGMRDGADGGETRPNEFAIAVQGSVRQLVRNRLGCFIHGDNGSLPGMDVSETRGKREKLQGAFLS